MSEGFNLMGGRLINYIVAALVIVVLIYLGFKFWDISQSDKIQKAQEQLEKMNTVIEEVWKTGEERRVIVFPPKDWVIDSFRDYDFPAGYCRKDNDCLCMCQDLECEGLKACQGFKFEVDIEGKVSGSEYGGSGGTIYSGATFVVREGILKLSEAEELIVSKENDIIKIRKVGDDSQ